MPLSHRIGLLALLLLGYAALTASDLLGPLDGRLYGWQEQLPETSNEQPLAVIAIDEASLAALGQWPWPRRLHARLIEQLSAAGATAIGLDLILAEPSRHGSDDDAALRDALLRSGRVVLPVAVGQQRGQWQISYPLAELASAAAALGHARAGLAENGALRHLDAQLSLPDGPLDAFPLALAQLGGELPTGRLPAPQHWYLPGDVERRMPPIFSYVEVLRGSVPMTQFAGKHLLIGVSSQGLAAHYPLAAGSGGNSYPALLFNALASATLLDGSMRRWLPSGAQHTLALLLLVAAVFCRARHGWCALGLAAAAVLLQQLFLREAIHFPIADTLASIALAWLGHRLYATDRLAAALSRLRGEHTAMLETIADGVLLVTAEGRISYANRRAAELLKLRGAGLTGRHINQLGLQGPPDWQPLALCDPNTPASRQSVYARLGSSGTRVIKINTSRMPAQRATVLAIDDVSALYRLQKRLRHQASHDALTGLPNRGHMQQHIERRIRAELMRSEPRQLAVIFMDFDNFKRINDVLGHSAGDELLVQLTSLLKQRFGKGFALSRFGGDEFMLLAENNPSHSELCSVLERFILALSQPFWVANHPLHCQCSIGVSLYPQHGQHAEELIRCADLAMYQAKHFNGSQYQFYSPSGNQTAYGLELEHALHQALERGELEVHYQPRIHLDSERPAGAEALLRWRDPQRGLRLPGSFIPAAEELGLMLRINDWVIQEVFRDIRSLHDAGHPPLRISMNLSAQQFMQDGLEAKLERAMQELGTPPGWVELEITENMLMHDFNRASQVITRLRARGLQVSLDDFGTGYSALNYLINLPVDTIKIDQSFIQQLQFKKSGDVTRAIVQLARDLGFNTVAEGAETGEQVDFLRDIGCDEVQGFFYSKALPLDEFQDYLASVH